MNKITKALKSVPSAQKSFSLVAIAALVIMPFAQGDVAQGAADKIDICHKTGSSWNFMQTPSAEAEGHFGHGDFLYEGPEGSKPEKDQWCADNAPSEEPETSTVTICKYDDAQNPLEGWDVFIEEGDNQYGGTTGADGCVEASDVPFGDYTLGEDLEDGWANVEGDGDSVSVDEETETFSLVNRELAACEDGLDNDDDGQTDFDNDPGCSSDSDDDETDEVPPTPSSTETGTLVVRKVVINDNGGTAATSSFSFYGNDIATTTFESDGQNDLVLPVGVYTVIEVESEDYKTTYDDCVSVSVSTSTPATCTITNDDIDRSGGGGNSTSTEEFTLTLDLTGEGNGKVLGDGIDCDSNAEETDCAQTYASGTVVELTVTPDDDSTFDESWTVGSGTCTGNNTPCSVTMNGNLNLVAHFGTAQSSGGGGRAGNGGSANGGGQVLGVSDEPEQVLGVSDQIAQIPAGAPNTGAGGSANGGLIGTLLSVLGLVGLVKFKSI